MSASEEGGLQLLLAAMPSGWSVRVPAPSSGGGGSLVQQGRERRCCPTRAAARPQEGLQGGHIAHGVRPSAAPRHTRGLGVG